MLKASNTFKSLIFSTLLGWGLSSCHEAVQSVTLEETLESKFTSDLSRAEIEELKSRYDKSESGGKDFVKWANGQQVWGCFNSHQNLLMGTKSFIQDNIQVSVGVTKKLYLQCSANEGLYVALLGDLTVENKLNIISHFHSYQEESFEAFSSSLHIDDIGIVDEELNDRILIHPVITIAFTIKEGSLQVKVSDEVEAFRELEPSE